MFVLKELTLKYYLKIFQKKEHRRKGKLS